MVGTAHRDDLNFLATFHEGLGLNAGIVIKDVHLVMEKQGLNMA